MYTLQLWYTLALDIHSYSCGTFYCIADQYMIEHNLKCHLDEDGLKSKIYRYLMYFLKMTS